MRRFAIIGAAGFVGTRMVEMFHLGHHAEVRPIVRRLQGLARLSRFELDCRVADARDAAALAKSFNGCEIVVHAAVGDENTIQSTIQPVWEACQAAGVRRLVYLSSGSVHGQTPAIGTDETSPLSTRQWNWYNNAKVRAERRLTALGRCGGLELVILRPTIVYGPRSRWVWEAAKAAEAGAVCLVNEGRGICNSIYVDNLVHAIKLAADAPRAMQEAFLVNDEETVTWRDFYASFAEQKERDGFIQVAPRPTPVPQADWLGSVRRLPGARTVLARIPSRCKRAVKAAWVGWKAGAAPNPWRMPDSPAPLLSDEMNTLQQCAWKFSNAKARQLLGYVAPVSFREAMARSIAWVRFAGGRGDLESGVDVAEAFGVLPDSLSPAARKYAESEPQCVLR